MLKVVQAPEDGDNPNLRPHNIAREAALLMKLRHPNVRELGSTNSSWSRACPTALTATRSNTSSRRRPSQ